MRSGAWETAALVAMLTACGAAQEPVPRDTGSEQAALDAGSLELVRSYGFCARDCTTRLTLAASGEGTVTVEEDRTTGATRSRTFQLTAEQAAAIQAHASRALSDPWEDVYGCPDCVDQGSLTLRAGVEEGVRTTRVDPKQRPEVLVPLLDSLGDVMDAHRP